MLRYAIVVVALVVGACQSPPPPVLVSAPAARAPAATSSQAAPRGRIATPEEAAAMMTRFSGDAGTDDAASTEPMLGRIAPESIKRLIRAAFPRFRRCYEVALAQTNGAAHGTVASQYYIGLDGTIEVIHSYAQDPSIPKSMVDCISTEYLKLQFPQPIGGKVMVTYPIDFQNVE